MIEVREWVLGNLGVAKMLSLDQIDSFHRDGYLVVEELLDTPTLDNIRAEYHFALTQICQHHAADAKLPAQVQTLSFSEQILAMTDAGIDYFQPLDISLPISEFEYDTPIHLGQRVFEMMTNTQILDAIEDLIGPEITSNPIQHVRIKPPLSIVSNNEVRAHIVKTDWHQDRAVALEQADHTQMVTLWLAITEATVVNGCLQVIPGSHKRPMQPHCPQSQLGIPEKYLNLDAAQPLPVGAGGAILFHPLTIHSSLDNHSNNIRWSFDLRYNVTGDPTGRPQFPEFIVRSRAHPETQQNSHRIWVNNWLETRARLCHPQPASTYHRWDSNNPICA